MIDDDLQPVPVVITPEFLQAILQAANQAGLPIPPPMGASPVAPAISIEKGWRVIGSQLGATIKRQNIFLRAGELGRVDQKTGQWRPFTPECFVGWVEEFVAFKRRGEQVFLDPKQARVFMRTDTFLEQIRPLEGIHDLRLPVTRKDGRTEWLKKGYDAPSKIFTVDLLPYEMDWDLISARAFLREHCEHYPFMKREGEDGTLESNRSYAVHVAAMLGAYCRAMIPAGVLRPMILYTANQQGSGKSTLAQMTFIPVFGETASNDMPRNDDELSKELACVAQGFVPFLFLDDIGRMLSSFKLNRFITSSRHGGRVMNYNNVRFDVPNVTQIFATGNNVKGSRDLAERALIVEMFYAGELHGRKFPVNITPHWLARPDVRRKFLSALCALVKHWTTADDGQRAILDKIEPHARFPEWTKLIASIACFAGYADPLTPPLEAFDEREDELKALLVEAASHELANRDFTRRELVDLAREHGLLEDVVGSARDGDLNMKSNIIFGLRLQIWRGREMTDKQGRRFQFGRGKQRRGATYPLTFMEPLQKEPGGEAAH